MPTATPGVDEARRLLDEGRAVPVYRELIVDGETPVSAYAKLTAALGREGSFLLESVVGGTTWAAYSFIGVRPRAFLRVGGGRWRLEQRGGVVDELARRGGRDPSEGPVLIEEGVDADAIAVLGRVLAKERVFATPGLPRFFGGAVGFFAYDTVRAIERLPATAPDTLGLPEASFVLTDSVVIFDNLRQTVKVVAMARAVDTAGDAAQAYAQALARIDDVVRVLGGPPTALAPLSLEARPLPAVESNFTRDGFMAAVARAQEYILAGDVFQVVLSQRFSAALGRARPFDVYRALRVINPSPYMFHLELPEATLAGASPEVLVRVEGGEVTVRPIAGTRPRGRDAAEDARLEAELRADAKELAEHVMLIDLGRNDVGRVAVTGSVRVEEQMAVERYSHVMHLVSRVVGRLRPEVSALDALRAAFPAGTLSGAPKIRAMEVIEELEPSRRGVYGGAVGYVSWTGNLDFAIAIRTLVAVGERVHIQAGAGIVADSDPAREYDETLSKAQAVLRALALAAGRG